LGDIIWVVEIREIAKYFGRRDCEGGVVGDVREGAEAKGAAWAIGDVDCWTIEGGAEIGVY